MFSRSVFLKNTLLNSLKTWLLQGSFWLILAVASVFLFQFILNHFTPFISDDFGYLRVVDIGDAIRLTIDHWHTQNGRALMTGLLYLLLLLPAPLLNVINAALFALFCYLISLLVLGQKDGFRPKLSARVYLLVSSILFLTLPMFGQTTLWIAGAASYLWPAVVMCLFLLPYRLYNSKSKSANLVSSRQRLATILTSLYMLLFGFVAGWTTEVSGAALLVIVFLFLVARMALRNKNPLWMYSGFMGLLGGYIMLARAPGVTARLDSIADARGLESPSTLALMINNWQPTVQHTFTFNLPLVVLTVTLFVLLLAMIWNSRDRLWIWMFITAGIVAYLPSAILISPRGQFFTGILFASAFLTLLLQLERCQKKVIISAALACSLFFSGAVYSLALQDTIRLYRYDAYRIESARQQVSDGVEVVQLQRLSMPPSWMQWSATSEEANFGMRIPYAFAQHKGIDRPVEYLP